MHDMTYYDWDSPEVLALDLSNIGVNYIISFPQYYSSLIGLSKDCPIVFTQNVAMSGKRRIFVTSSIFTISFS